MSYETNAESLIPDKNVCAENRKVSKPISLVKCANITAVYLHQPSLNSLDFKKYENKLDLCIFEMYKTGKYVGIYSYTSLIITVLSILLYLNKWFNQTNH